ncbi:ribosomal protein [Histomonas meleagridis]|uniref:ribosomal protein n=1 Tax=Histomonas meleagridis TaxID=135588 RepID=UPI003559C8BE|nr:ribosomal protein [Histomonas meleagridis]
MWLLTREVLRLRGELLRTQEWKVLPDLYFYRDTRDEQNIQEQIDHEGEETVATDVTTVDAAPNAESGAPSTEQEWNNAGEGAGW